MIHIYYMMAGQSPQYRVGERADRLVDTLPWEVVELLSRSRMDDLEGTMSVRDAMIQTADMIEAHRAMLGRSSVRAALDRHMAVSKIMGEVAAQSIGQEPSFMEWGGVSARIHVDEGTTVDDVHDFSNEPKGVV